MWYYDAEGIIRSSGINFIKDLPYFLALLLAFQRFDDSAWGNCSMMKQTDSKVAVEMYGPDGESKLISTGTDQLSYIRGRYGIVGRSTQVLRAKISGDDSDGDYVLKISYPEELRSVKRRVGVRSCPGRSLVQMSF